MGAVHRRSPLRAGKRHHSRPMTSGARQYRVFFGTGTDELTGDEVEEWLMITESHALALTGKDYTVQTRICTEWEPLEGGVPLADTSARPK